MTFARLTSSFLTLSLALVLPACIIDKDLGDTPGSTTTASTTDTGTATTATTGDAPLLCPDSPNFACSVAFTCEDFPCGGLQDWFDADGCPRQPCGADEPCPAGQVCYQTGVWGECNASGVSCQDGDGACGCSMTLDCMDVSYCVPADLGPPTDCGAITDAQACLDAGCTTAEAATPVSFVGDACVCASSQPTCLWFEDDAGGGSASPGAFYRKSTLEVAVFSTIWAPPPHGWAPCEDDPQAPPACACALDTCAEF